MEKYILKYNKPNNGIKVAVAHYSPNDTTKVNQIGLVEAFRDCGFDTIGFNFYQCFWELGHKRFNDMFFEFVKMYKPNWIHLESSDHSNMFNVETIEKITKHFPNIYITCWGPDIRFTISEFYKNISKLINKPLICSEGQLDFFRSAGCSRIDYWQSGFDPKYFYRKSENERNLLREYYKHDIVFCANGDPFPELPEKALRNKFTEMIYEKYPDRFHVYGYKWEYINDKFKHLDYYKMNDVYNGSKIILSVNAVNNVKKYFSDRQVISMATGTLTLSKYVPGIEEYFTNHKDLVWFDTYDECVEQIDYYLSHDLEREEIGKCGAETVLKNHTYLSKVKELAYRCGFLTDF